MLLGSTNSVRRNVLALAIAAPWLIVVLVRLLGVDRIWPLVPLVAFTPQTLLTLLVPLVVALVLRAKWSVAIVGAAMISLAFVIAPRLITNDQPAASGKTLRILTANLLHGDASPAPLVAAIRSSRADVIALQEASLNNIAELRAAGILKTHPYVQEHSADGMFANFTVSRKPLAMLPNADDSAESREWPGMRIGGTGVTFYNFHSRSPVTPSRESEWRAGLTQLPASNGELRVIAGDFNATLDHHYFRKVLASGYRDSADETGNGLKWTWSVSRMTRLVIDHVLAPPSVAVRSYRVYDLPGSDHNAVAVTLRLPVD
ncbi:MAG: endonuclease/exonuclease/phosphatase family protein [Solirubrobacterales bacterium]